MLSTFYVILIITIIGLLKYRGKQILCNDLFFLIYSWVLILGVYFLSGIKYSRYGFSLQLIIYVFLCAVCYYRGRVKGMTRSVYVFSNSSSTPSKLFSFLGVAGVLLYVYDVIRLNNVLFMFVDSQKNEIELSIIGTFGILFVPILMVEGLHLLIHSIKTHGRINLLAICLLFLYTLPCIIHSGRESILYIGVCVVALYGYKSYFKTISQKTKHILPSIFWGGLISSGIIFLLYFISTSRFGDNEINIFLSMNQVPQRVVDEASYWGNFEFIFYNILSYFGHQVPFLDFTLREYDGPFMCGMFELNIISRRLPDFLGLDYKLVSISLQKLYKSGVDFTGSWNTVLGSFIFDFTPIGSIAMCYFAGNMVGRLRKKLLITLDERYAVLMALCCMCCFTTIMMGPFYNTLIYGTLIWWFIFYHKFERKRIA